MNKQAHKEKLNLSISREAKQKVKVLADQMEMTISEFIEGLIFGVQIIPGKNKKESN